MRLKRRKCPVKMRLIPYGAGWTDVYADFGEGELYFIISSAMGDGFEALMKSLYYLYPAHNSDEAGELIECKFGQCEWQGNQYVVTKIVDDIQQIHKVWRNIPYQARFTWDEERAYSNWTLTREASEDVDFLLHVDIVYEYDEDDIRRHHYTVAYRDLCYAVADACTKAIKKHGFLGYHSATYTEDMNLRYLLFLKSVALGNMEAVKLTWYDKKGAGETSDFKKEMKLLLFDM